MSSTTCEQLAEAVRGGARVDHQRADVAVGRGRREHRVGQAPLLADLLEQAARHAPAEDVVGDPEGVAVVVVDGQRPPPDGHVGLLGGPVDDDQRHDVGAGRVALGGDTGLAEVEQAVDGGQHAVVGEVAGRGDDEVAGPVPALVEGGDVVAAHGLDGLAGAEGLAAERVLGVEALVERGEHEVVGGVLAHEDLLDDDLTLGVELVGPERRLAHDVGQQAQAGLELGHGQAQVVRRVLAARVGVHLAADGVDRHGDRAGRPLARCP